MNSSNVYWTYAKYLFCSQVRFETLSYWSHWFFLATPVGSVVVRTPLNLSCNSSALTIQQLGQANWISTILPPLFLKNYACCLEIHNSSNNETRFALMLMKFDQSELIFKCCGGGGEINLKSKRKSHLINWQGLKSLVTSIYLFMAMIDFCFPSLIGSMRVISPDYTFSFFSVQDKYPQFCNYFLHWLVWYH